MESYYKPEDLHRFGEMGRHRRELYDKFSDWYNDCMAEGALSKKTKSLIALAVAHAIQCAYCIDHYAVESKDAGSSMDEMVEAIHVASSIRGGSSLIHGIQMLNALDRE